MKDEIGSEGVFELKDSEYILNIEFYLHRAILKWEDALEAALKSEKGIDVGLTNRGLAGDMIIGIAKAKGVVHWDKQEITDDMDPKTKKEIESQNKEAEKFRKSFKIFLDDLLKKVEDGEISTNIKNVKKTDYQVYYILNSINKKGSKQGKVIV